METSALLQKYNVPVPRYTSYPTVPSWKAHIELSDWQQSVRSRFQACNKSEGISLYIHLPFCESLCTYCGCNKKITGNHSVEEPYIAAIHAEWALYQKLFSDRPILREIHLGGGTPTFFAPGNLRALLQPILESCQLHEEYDFSFEGHPNNTTTEHLRELFDLGFRRVSFGVQDNDPEVQRIINRIQPVENLRRVTESARSIGYQSVNFDLIYGLPKQRLESIRNTAREVIELKPDRIAFYSYAHVPWTSRGQRLFDESDLPGAAEKLELYEAGRTLFIDAGYQDIGMDHFALQTDDLVIAANSGKLHRNFMGYTTQNSGMLIGLGVSSISDTGVSYAQNKKALHDYYAAIESGNLAIEKGYFLTEEDLVFKQYILDTSCRQTVSFKNVFRDTLEDLSFPELALLESDGLIKWNSSGLQVTALGRNFTRNICRAFDLHLLRSQQEHRPQLYSKAI